MNRKHEVLQGLYDWCNERRTMTFDNDVVKDAAKACGFGNLPAIKRPKTYFDRQ